MVECLTKVRKISLFEAPLLSTQGETRVSLHCFQGHASRANRVRSRPGRLRYSGLEDSESSRFRSLLLQIGSTAVNPLTFDLPTPIDSKELGPKR